VALLKLKIISLGRVRQRFIQEGEQEYLARLKGSASVEIVEIDCDKVSQSSVERAKHKESELLLARIDPGEFLCALDERGKTFTSELFAQEIQNRMNQGHPRIVFALGASHGFDESVRKRANLVLSLSAMTFPFQLSRLILIEQLYRALSILSGHPYHKK